MSSEEEEKIPERLADWNPKGYKLDEDGLADVDPLDKEHTDRSKKCYDEIIDVVDHVIAKHYTVDPLSPKIFNHMFGPLYVSILDKLISTFPDEVKEPLRKMAAKDLGNLIQFIQENTSEDLK